MKTIWLEFVKALGTAARDVSIRRDGFPDSGTMRILATPSRFVFTEITLMNDNDNIESVLREDRVFPPPAGFSESIGGAWIASMADYEAAYRRSIEDPDDFWGEAAREHRWIKPFTRV